MENELIDIYDKEGNPRGTKLRALVHKDGDWHNTFHCWIIYKNDEGEDYILLQRRSDEKKDWPGFLDITAAGHILSGETISDGIREVNEELGIMVDLKNLIPVGTRICDDSFENSFINREFQSIFFLIENKPLHDYKLQISEVSAIIPARINELISLFTREQQTIKANGLSYIKKDVAIPEEFIIDIECFIPTGGNYYQKIFQLAKNILSGKVDLYY